MYSQLGLKYIEQLPVSTKVQFVFHLKIQHTFWLLRKLVTWYNITVPWLNLTFSTIFSCQIVIFPMEPAFFFKKDFRRYLDPIVSTVDEFLFTIARKVQLQVFIMKGISSEYFRKNIIIDVSVRMKQYLLLKFFFQCFCFVFSQISAKTFSAFNRTHNVLTLAHPAALRPTFYALNKGEQNTCWDRRGDSEKCPKLISKNKFL